MRSCVAKAKHIAFSALFTLIVACDSNSSSSSNESASPAKPSTDFTIEGAVELFPAGAEVAVYPVIDGKVERSSAYGSGVTDALGRYKLSLPPVAAHELALIEAVAAPGMASVRCPLLDGCQGVAFGAAVELEQPLIVAAPIKRLGAGGTYNLSAITTVLAKSLEASTPTSNEAFLDELEARALYLADRFELFGDLAQQPLVDWTRPEDLQHASMDGLRHSALGPAAVSAWCTEDSDAGVTEAFQKIIERLGSGELAATAKDDPRLSELTINTSILRYANHWNGTAPMAALISERRAANAVLALTESPYAVGPAAPGSPVSKLASTKKFVDDIRQAGTSINQKQLNSFRSLGDLLKAERDLLPKMGLNLDGIDFLQPDESDRFLAALGKASVAMLSVLADHFSAKPVINEVDGINVAYIDYGDRVQVGVQQNLNACDPPEPACNVGVFVTLDVAVELVETNVGIDYYRLTRPDIRLFGRLTHSGLQIIIPQSTPASFNAERMVMLFGADPNRPDEDAFRFDMDMSGLRGSIPVSLAFDAADERSNTDYIFELGAGNASLRYGSSDSAFGVEIGKIHRTEKRYRLFNTQGVYLDIAGKGEDRQQAPQFGLSVALDNARDNAELRVNQVTERHCTVATQGECVEASNEFTTEGEDAPPPLGMTATVLGRAKLDGYAGPVWLKFSGSRVDHNATAINFLTVSQPGNGLWINGEFNDDGAIQLEAYNRQGYYFDIHRDGSTRDGGVYSPTGELVVELKDMGSWIKLTYPDGTFDSI